MRKKISLVGKVIVYWRRLRILVGQYEVQKQMGGMPLPDK